MKKQLLVIMVMAMALALGPAMAQQKKRPPKGQGKANPQLVQGKKQVKKMGFRGPVAKKLMQHLYPVELVRHYAADIGLTEDQIKKLRKVVNKAKNQIEDLKWDVELEANKLVQLIEKDAPTNQVLAQMDKVFKIENKIKKKNLEMMLQIKKILTKKQRTQLDDLKAQHMKNRSRKGGHQRGFPPPPPHEEF